jgi:hypothetical protein
MREKRSKVLYNTLKIIGKEIITYKSIYLRKEEAQKSGRWVSGD